MDGVTDAAFRFITAHHGGADVMFTEFVNIQSAFYSPHTLIKDLTYSQVERPVVAQIYLDARPNCLQSRPYHLRVGV